MRICFIAHGIFPHVEPYIDYFRGRGHDVHLVSFAPGPPRDVPTHDAWSSKRFSKAAGKWSYLPAILRARRVLRSLAPDVVHAHYATSAGLAAYVCGVHPYVVTAHGTDVARGVKSIFWRQMLRRIFRNAACVNPVSNELRDLVLSLGIPMQKVETFTLGIDTKKFSFSKTRWRDSAAPLRLVCTRRFEEVYDHRTIILGLAIAARRQIDLRVSFFGDGSLRESLERLANGQGLGDKATFFGELPNSRLPALLREHDIFLSASMSDGTSLSLLEAMASGLYPVVSDIPANRVWINHGTNGLLHRISDPQSLADSIAASLEDPEKVMEALRHNCALVMSRGDRMVHMRRLEELYYKLASRESKTANLSDVPFGINPHSA